MKVLHILNQINFSGAEIMLNLAAPIFKEKGYELHFLSTGRKRGDYAKVLEKAGYEVYHIPFSKTPKYFWQLYKKIKKGNFDVIHIHPERAFLWHALIAQIAGSKVIVRTIHSIFLFNGFLRIRKSLARWFAREILGVIFHSIGDSVEYIEKENFNNPTIKIYNWIDEKKFYPETSINEKKSLRNKIGISENDFVIVSVGSCSKVKRHHLIIESLKKIINEVPDILYLHIGKGDLLSDEIELARTLGLENNIIFAGQKENVRDYLVASDLFVMVSEYEGFGNATLEAMYCGLPLVVSDTIGLRDLVIDRYNGILVKNLKELEKKILVLYNSPELRKMYSKNSLKLSKEKFSMEKSIKKLINLYCV